MTDTRQASSAELSLMAAHDALAWLTERAKPRHGDKRLPRIAHLERRLAEHRAGPRAQNLDGGVAGGDRSDPTFDGTQRPDQAEADAQAVRTLARRIRTDAMALEWLAKGRLTTTQDDPDAQGDPGCAWCGRVDRWSPVYVTTDFASVLAEPLPAPVSVCSPCRSRVRSTGAVPSNADLLTFHRTGHWPKLKAAA